MKHYEIKKGTNGWTKAEVIRPDGIKESFNCFFNRKEAEIWCYARVRYYWGREIAKREFE